jgi:hypothetical protein
VAVIRPAQGHKYNNKKVKIQKTGTPQNENKKPYKTLRNNNINEELGQNPKTLKIIITK